MTDEHFGCEFMNSTRYALAGGICHLLSVVIGAWIIDRTAERTVRIAPSQLTEPWVVWIVIGAFVVGAVPALLFATQRLVLPAVTILGLLAGSVYATWADYRETIATGGEIGISPRPFTFYILLWVLPLGAALCAGLVEYVFRQQNLPTFNR